MCLARSSHILTSLPNGKVLLPTFNEPLKWLEALTTAHINIKAYKLKEKIPKNHRILHVWIGVIVYVVSLELRSSYRSLRHDSRFIFYVEFANHAEITDQDRDFNEFFFWKNQCSQLRSLYLCLLFFIMKTLNILLQ